MDGVGARVGDDGTGRELVACSDGRSDAREPHDVSFVPLGPIIMLAIDLIVAQPASIGWHLAD